MHHHPLLVFAGLILPLLPCAGQIPGDSKNSPLSNFVVPLKRVV